MYDKEKTKRTIEAVAQECNEYNVNGDVAARRDAQRTRLDANIPPNE